MAYGTIKVDQVTFTNGGVDQTISVSGIVQSISGDITATGTIQGATVIGTSTVSGATVTGDAGAFTIITGGTAGFTTVTGATITGGHVTAASGTYTGNVTAAAFIPTGSSVPTNGVYLPSANNVAISTNGNGALFIDEDGKFGIGTADPDAMLDITPDGASTAVLIRNNSSNFSAIGFRRYASISSSTAITANAEPSGYLGIIAGGFEKTRIDNSGSLLVGISSPRTNFFNGTVRTTLQVENASSGSGFISSVLNANNTLGPGIVLGKSRGATLGTNTVVVSGDAIGTLSFQGADGTNFVEAATIAAAVDGTPGTNDMPGRLVFSTTADGASSPTERLRIDSSGNVGIGTTGPSVALDVVGQVKASVLFNANGEGFIRGDAAGELRLQEGTSGVTFYNNSNNAEHARIDSSGRLGLGTSSPSGNLDVRGVSGTTIIRAVGVDTGGYADVEIFSTGTTGSSRLYFADTAAKSGSIIYSHSDNSLAFATNGGSEAARIDSSGRLLVGTSSSVTASALQLVQNVVSGGGQYVAGNSATSLALNGDVGYLRFYSNAGSVWNEGARIAAIADAAHSSTSAATRLVFSTTADGSDSPAERMRITSTGATLIGSTGVSDGERLKVESSGAGNSTAYFVYASSDDRPVVMSYHAGSTGATSRKHYEFRNSAGAEVGSIAATGTATSYNTSSDYRLKENIVALSGAIDRVNQLQVHRFNFISDPDTTVDGFIAHEAQAVVPECVTGEKDAVDENGKPVYQGIDQSKLVPLLTAALQEALQKIETFEQRLNDAGIA